MSTLDEFFREKLATHSMTVPEGAWERVEAGLGKKNNGLIWLRWAAALLAGVLLFGTLWLQRNTGPEMAQNKKVQPGQSPVLKKELAPPLADRKTESSQTQLEVKKSHNQQVKKVLRVPQEQQKQELITSSEITPVEELEKTEMEEVKPVIETAPVAEQKSKAIVLTYTLDPVITASEAREENSEANVVAETDKKSKGFKRMIDLANEVKNSESPLGELRLKKSELFALDLKKKPTSKKQ